MAMSMAYHSARKRPENIKSDNAGRLLVVLPEGPDVTIQIQLAILESV